MRRTYRSKKESGGGLDPKEALFLGDAKSSVFDAFYIQNIKQTKRELSCMGSSNHCSYAANRVRKRKPVRKVLKESERSIKDCTSKSTYLTPDKSIHVNRGVDLFDQLLNSTKQNDVSTTSPFWQVNRMSERRTYKQNLKANIRNNNSSSNDSTESDKENINQTNLDYHKLVIEKELKLSPVVQDDSINQIVNNISLLQNMAQNSPNLSPQKTKRLFKNRLTKTSLLLPKDSPLSSTPFKEKYSKRTIFNFSPIGLKMDDTYHKEASVNKNSCSLLESSNLPSPVLTSSLKGTLNSKKSKDSNSNKPKTDSNYEKEVIDNFQNNHERLALNDFVDDENTEALAEYFSKSNKLTPERKSIVFPTKNKSKNVSNSTKSDLHSIKYASLGDSKYNTLDGFLQTSAEPEPFLGFSSNAILDIKMSYSNSNKNDTYSDRVAQIVDYSSDSSERCDKANSIIKRNICRKSRIKRKTQYNSPKGAGIHTDSSSLGSDLENKSLYNTCNSLDSCMEESLIKDSKNVATKDNDKLNANEDGQVVDVFSSSYSSHSESLNNSNVSNNEIKKPMIVLEKLDDKIFSHYYNRNETLHTSNCSTSSNEPMDNVNASVITIDKNTIGDTDNGDNIKTQDNLGGKQPSYVTRRRRNEINDTLPIILDDSGESTGSTDCNKTVISTNNTETDELNKVDQLKMNELKKIMLERKSKKEKGRKTCMEPESPRLSIKLRRSTRISRNSLRENLDDSNLDTTLNKNAIILEPGKRWERSLSIFKRMTLCNDFDSFLEDEDVGKKGRMYRDSVVSTMELQDRESSPLHNDSFSSCRSSIISTSRRGTIRIIKEPDTSKLRKSTRDSSIYEDLTGFLSEDCDDTVVELSKLSITDDKDVTVEKIHESTVRGTTARDYVLRRCNQTESIPFDECYPDTALKNCHKIGEGVYGEVFLWRARDGRARVMKIIPIGGTVKVNGEQQKNFDEIISEIVIAMELSALRTSIPDIESHFEEGTESSLDLRALENATDCFNEVLAVRLVHGKYPSRLLELWELYDECKGSDNDNPESLPRDQQFLVLELANAGQDLESYNFANAEQAYAVFVQVAYGLAVAEDSLEFEHRDLHWGNVLIAPTDEKWVTVIVSGTSQRIPTRGVRATVIDYSLSRAALRLGGGAAALYADLAADDTLFRAAGDYQFDVYRLMRDRLDNDWKNFEPYTNILWLHYTVDKMITALRYKRVNTKLHKHYISKLKSVKNRILQYNSALDFVLNDNEL